MELSLFELPLLFIGHVGLSGKRLRKVGLLQYFFHWLYAVCEPTILRIVDFIFSIKVLTQTKPGRMLLLVIAKLSWFFPHGIVLTTEAAQRMIDFIVKTGGPEGARLAVGPCVCQRALGRWQEPSFKDMVILYGADIYTHLKLGYKLITAEEAKRLLKTFHRVGLVHSLDLCMRSGKWAFVICNCDREICVLARVYLILGAFLWPGAETVTHDPQFCIGVENCGLCIERCIFGVNSTVEGDLRLDYAKCMGCGLCVSTCIGQARTMAKRQDYKHQHQIPAELLLGDHEKATPG
jgi:Pyruvate/2-oxoacid:ferredoxin oxidoreductase delta subunit